MKNSIYFDHASTSCPKPPALFDGIECYLREICVSPGRGGYQRAVKADQLIFETRRLLANIFNAQFPHQIVFTLNSTHALNLAIKGILKSNDHVVITNYEHNAVLRPLENLKRARNISYDIFEYDSLPELMIKSLEKKIRKNTRLIIVNHGSNVTGAIAPIEELGLFAKKNGILFLVDGSQTAGLLEIDVERCNIDFLAFTGHKSLLGPSGVGGLYVRNAEILETFYEGGTGSNSISLQHPEALPIKFEAGTLNCLGIAGLHGSLTYLLEKGIEKNFAEKIAITNVCLEALQAIPEVIIYGETSAPRLPVISFNIRTILPQEVAYLLDAEHNIMVRSGLHCAPLIHKSLGTFPQGTVRISFGYENSCDQIDVFITALRKIIERVRI